MGKIVLGTGVLDWPRIERQTDRYGTVLLFRHADRSDPEQVKLESVEEDTYGRLVAKVIEARRPILSGPKVDPMTVDLASLMPKAGQAFVLGKGYVFYEDGAFGLKPEDGRDERWLHVGALHRVHNQTVTLSFKPL